MLLKYTIPHTCDSFYVPYMVKNSSTLPGVGGRSMDWLQKSNTGEFWKLRELFYILIAVIIWRYTFVKTHSTVQQKE